MAEYPALPLWTDSYLADTLHLGLEEHGAYLKLLMIAWRTKECGVPNDDDLIARMLGVSKDRWLKRLKPVLLRFFETEGNLLTQKRLLKERKHLDRKRGQQRRAGKASALKRQGSPVTDVGRPLQRPGQRKGNARPNETSTTCAEPIPTPIEESTSLPQEAETSTLIQEHGGDTPLTPRAEREPPPLPDGASARSGDGVSVSSTTNEAAKMDTWGDDLDPPEFLKRQPGEQTTPFDMAAKSGADPP